MAVQTLFPEETEEMRDARRMYEKRWDRLLRKVRAQVQEKFAPEYVLDVLRNSYNISADYVKTAAPDVYAYIAPLLAPTPSVLRPEKPAEGQPAMPAISAIKVPAITPPAAEEDDPVGSAEPAEDVDSED